MMGRFSLPYFGGLFTALGGRGPASAASELLNVRTGSRLEPRRGFARLTARPEGPVDVHGLMALSGAGNDSGAAREILAVRTFGGRTYPVALPLPFIPGAAFAEVLDGEDAVAMEPTPVSAFVYGSNAYVIQPGAAKSLYRHKIGDPASFAAIQDASYVEPPDSPELILSGTGPRERRFTGDAIATEGGDFGGDAATVDPAGKIVVTCSEADRGSGDGSLRVRVTFAAPMDLTGYGALTLAVEPGEVLRFFRNPAVQKIVLKRAGAFESFGAPIPVKVSGTHSDATEGLVAGNLLTIAVDLRDAGDVTAVEGFAVSLAGYVDDNESSGTVFTVFPMQLWGGHLLAPDAGAKPWDEDAPEEPIRYAARMKAGVSAPVPGVFSAIEEGLLSAAAVAGPLVSGAAHRAGQTARLAWTGFVSESFPDDSPVQWLRYDGAAWRVLGESEPGAEESVLLDAKRQHELAGLAAAEGLEGYVPPAPPPPFTTRGLVSGLAYKEWAVYFFEGGTQNVRHSRVGEPEELRVKERVPAYDPDDGTQPADYSLEGRSDEPLGGVQAGQILVVFGRAGVYTQYGDSPISMTPVRRVPETSAPAGPRAFCRFRFDGGGYSAAWLDAHGNVYALTTAPRFSGDANAEPAEISRTIRGFAREFLGADLSGAILQYDEARDSLWIVLGRRALVLRPGDPIEGARRWEAYEFRVVEDPYGAQLWTAWSRISDPTQFGGGASWDYHETTLSGKDEVELMGAGATSQTLRRTGFLVDALPADSEVLTVEARLTDEGVGPLTREAQVFALDPGTILSGDPGGVFPLVFAPGPQADYEIIQAGGLAAQIEVARTDNPEWYDPDNWTYSFPAEETRGGSPQSVPLSFTAFYTGPGEKPTNVRFSVSGYVSAGYVDTMGGGDTVSVGLWTATVFNGLGQTATGGRTDTAPDGLPGYVVASGSGPIEASGSNGVLTGTVFMSASGTPADRINSVYGLTAAAPLPPEDAIYRGLVEMRARYTMGAGEWAGTFDALAFDRGESYALRSDGALTILESDVAGEPIAGPSRDAGRAMPEWRWLSGWQDGPLRRVADVTGVRSSPFALTTLADSPGARYAQTLGANRTYGRFPTGAQSVRWRFGATGTDASGALDALTFDIVTLASRRADRDPS